MYGSYGQQGGTRVLAPKENSMKMGDIIFPIRCCGVALLSAVMAALLAPSPVQAGACMDGKLTAAIDYGLNDIATKTVKKITIKYTIKIQPNVKSKVECIQASSTSTDLTCRITEFNSYIYIIKGKSPITFANPGMFGGNNNVEEKICTAMDLAVYYLTGGKL